MTRESAIKQLKRMKMDMSHTGDEYNTIMVAIKALEQELVLDKIRAEIEKMDYLTIEDGSDGYDNYVDEYDVLQIIDKYKAESEG